MFELIRNGDNVSLSSVESMQNCLKPCCDGFQIVLNLSDLWYVFIWLPRLYTLDGRPVRGPTELESNHYYVAVGT